MKHIIAVCLAASAALAVATTAQASPLIGVSAAKPAIDNTLSSRVTFRCTRDDDGWRYMRGDRRVDCRPNRPRGAYWGWRSEGGRSGWWHSRNNRWHDGNGPH